jgi:Conjugal transfer/entry exclusion protein
MKKTIKVLILTAALLFQAAVASAAMAVYDATAVAKLTAELEQWTQQMTYWKQQLASIDSTNTTALQTQISTYQTLQSELDGLLTDYDALATNWDALYTDYTSDTWTGTTTSDYLADLETVNAAMQNAQRQAMVAQGLAADTYSDLATLSTLLSANQNATGTVQAQQITNQIAALQVKQLVRLQQMLAQYNKAQLLNMREQRQATTRAQKGFETLVPDAEDVAPNWDSTFDYKGGKSSTED